MACHGMLTRRGFGGIGPDAWFAGTVLVGWLLVIGCWSVASPLMSGPDEPAQIFNAVAVTHGQIDVSTRRTPIGPQAFVRVPEYIAHAGPLANCLARHPTVSAACQSPVHGSWRNVLVPTQFSHYPPVFYAVTGAPSLFVRGFALLVLIRAACVVLAAALLTLAVMFLRWAGWGAKALLTVVAATTPMTLSLGGVVNNSALEITAATAVWAGAVYLANEGAPSRGRLTCWWGAVLGLAMARTTGLIFLPAIVFLALWVVNGAHRGPFMAARVAGRQTWAPVAVGMGLSGSYLAASGAPGLLGVPPTTGLSFYAAAEASVDTIPTHLTEVIGTFGWLDTPVPIVVTLAWYAAVGVLAAWNVTHRSWRTVLVCVALSAGSMLLPALLEAQSYARIGLFWQGRYVLPMLVGVPILLLANRRLGRAPLSSVAVLIAVGEVIAFQQQIRRYTVGLQGPILPFHPKWQPAIPWQTLTVVILCVAMLFLAYVVRQDTLRTPDAQSLSSK